MVTGQTVDPRGELLKIRGPVIVVIWIERIRHAVAVVVPAAKRVLRRQNRLILATITVWIIILRVGHAVAVEVGDIERAITIFVTSTIGGIKVHRRRFLA